VGAAARTQRAVGPVVGGQLCSQRDVDRPLIN
jgi:hypothetical protein